MVTTRWVPPEDIERVMRSVLYQRLAARVRLIICPIMDLPAEHPPETSPYVEVHPDGLVEFWDFDGSAHFLAHATIVPRDTSADLTERHAVFAAAF